MFISVFLGALAGYLCGALVVVGYSLLRSSLANKRVDRQVKELVEAMRSCEPEPTRIKVPLVRAGGDSGN